MLRFADDEDNDDLCHFINTTNQCECTPGSLFEFRCSNTLSISLEQIDNDLNELKFALDLGNNYLSKMIMNHKIEQLGQLVSIGLETINPKVAQESPLNPKNWNPITFT